MMVCLRRICLVEERVYAEIITFLYIGEEPVRPGKDPRFLVALLYEAAWYRGEHVASGAGQCEFNARSLSC